MCADIAPRYSPLSSRRAHAAVPNYRLLRCHSSVRANVIYSYANKTEKVIVGHIGCGAEPPAFTRESEAMAHDEVKAPQGPQKLVIRNIGLLLSGDLAKP